MTRLKVSSGYVEVRPMHCLDCSSFAEVKKLE